MALARAAAVVATAPSSALPAAPIPKSAKPVTATEQYWAARALTAEALLSVKTQHHAEIRTLAVVEETKRMQEVARVHRMHEVRQRRLELAAVALLALLAALAASFLYTLHQTQSPARKSGSLHFTIPILSPFASVVEHESSVIGTKTLSLVVLTAAVLAYGCFRFWITRLASR